MIRRMIQRGLMVASDALSDLAMMIDPPQPGLPSNEEDEEEEELPLGHPVVTLSPEARKMIDTREPRVREPKQEPEKPLPGSLAARRQRT